MPFYHMDKYGYLLERKCACGGTPYLLLDPQQDYVVRCSKCHESTDVFMRKEDAVDAWNKNNCTGPFDMLTDDLEKHLSHIKNLYISSEYFWYVNEQSCDCESAIIDTGTELIRVGYCSEQDDEEYLELDELSGYNKEMYKYKVDLSDKDFKLSTIKYYENGSIEAIRFQFEDVFLFIFPSEHEVIITMSKYDLMEDIRMDFPEVEATLDIEYNV